MTDIGITQLQEISEMIDMKQLKCLNKMIVMLFALLMLIAAPTALAQTNIHKQLQWPFYDSGSEACYPLGTETGNGPLFGLELPNVDPAALAASIDKHIENTQPDSPLKGMGARFVAAGQHFNVNPAMMVGIAQKESSLGTAKEPVVYNNNNPFGITGNNPPQEKQYPVNNGYTSYPSFEVSIDGASDYVSAGYIKSGAPYASKTILEMMKSYTPPSPEASTKKTLDVMHKILDGIATGSAETSGDQSSLDLDAIAKKYDLHSAMVKQLGGPTLGSYNADSPPNTPASVMKVIIADAFLSTNPDLDKIVTIKSSQLYGAGDPYSAGQKITLKETLINTLMRSHNTTPNIMTDEVGGLNAITEAAHQLGYTSTQIRDYYSDKGGSNETTVSDITKAMEKIYNTPGNNYGVAKEALQNSTFDFGINSVANKWGETSKVTGNSAIMAVGASEYIITMYANRADADNSIKDATNEIASKLSGAPVITPGTPGANGCQNSNLLGGANGFEMSQMVSYDQGDPEWADHPYGTDGTFNSPLRKSGCGPTALAMIGATLLGDRSITPKTLATQYGDEYHVNQGSSWALFPRFAQDYNLKIKDIDKDFGAAAQIIRNGGLVLISVGVNSYFTNGGHLMVIRAVTADGTGFYLADPAGDGAKGDSETRAFPKDFLANEGQLLNLWGYYK